ncbi:MAG: radical SAM protein [Nitrospinae bacterium]|nr:radical SAM protein [Nitrospinota bacterium]
MLGVTKLLCGTATASDVMRYGRSSKELPSNLLSFSRDKRPVVVWNMTRTCNLSCIHCYSESKDKAYEGELTTEQGKKMIDDLIEFKVPTILFSGGEPLMHPDIFELAEYAIKGGLRAVFSTNGTLINEDNVKRIKDVGLSYVGISIDGTEEVNDRFRAKKGAFREAMNGIQTCLKHGMKVGLRFTLNKHNYPVLDEVLNLLEEENIPRCCVYHLVYAGRGTKMMEADVTREEARKAVDMIFDKALYFKEKGITKEILTVDNHCDAVYMYMRIKKTQPERAEEVLKMLQWNGGASSGIGVADIDNLGNVHADQFWKHHTFGNVKERKFGDIWTDTSDPIMAGLKDRKKLLKGRCGKCEYLDVCNGNFRVRAEAVTGDIWESDPACYLTDAEIFNRI